MADEKDKPGYSDELIERALQFISDPTERAEKKVLWEAFGRTMLGLDKVGLDPSAAVVA